jgi:uridylate kinase
MLNGNIVLKIGGSLLYDEKLQLREGFLHKLKQWFETNKRTYNRIVIVVGGGRLSRFIGGQAVSFFYNATDIHGLAMQGTQLNAQVLKGLLSGPEENIKTPEDLSTAMKYIADQKLKHIISGGVKEGWSTDMDAAIFTNLLGLKRFYKLSNIDHIYTADPKLDPKATPISEITWKGYAKMFGIVDGTTHAPNSNLPVDPVCTQFCLKKGISMFVSGGETLMEKANLESVFESGTYIHP